VRSGSSTSNMLRDLLETTEDHDVNLRRTVIRVSKLQKNRMD
jgi:hypothetical protein